MKKGHKKKAVSSTKTGDKKFFKGDAPETASNKGGFVIYNNKEITSPQSSKFTSGKKEDSVFRADTGRGISVSARKPHQVAMIDISSQKNRQFMTPKVSRANLKSDRVYETPKEPQKDESFHKISIDLKRSHSKQTLDHKQAADPQKKKRPSGRSKSKDRALSPNERVLSPKPTVTHEQKYTQQVIRSPKQPEDSSFTKQRKMKNREILNDINDLDQEIQRYKKCSFA